MKPVISTVPLMHLASGDELMLQLYRFVGTKPGKKVYIQSNLHGAELAGNAVMHQFIEWLGALSPDQLEGELWLVPMCNPLGVNTRAHHFSSGRYNPYDGRDWNRIFWDYEQVAEDIPAFAQQHFESELDTIFKAYRQEILINFQEELSAVSSPTGVAVHRLYSTRLQALMLDADYVIDLHTSGNRGMTYLYYCEGRAESARLFGLDFAILLDQYDGNAFDESFMKPWLALERAFAQLGREIRCDVEAFTLELGTAMQFDPEAVVRGLWGIQHYLSQKGVLKGITNSPIDMREMLLTRTSQMTKYHAPAGGMIQNRVEPGTWVKAETRLYSLLSFNKTGQLPQLKDVRAEHSGLVYDVSINHSVNQGEYVLAVLQPDA
ncbi:MAG TPA: succinylglutamate desuccinylase/aspartoacylase family protein [Leptolyngbyaceae cyanobacterium]